MNPSRLMGWMEVLMTAFSLLDAINALGKDVVFLSKPKNVALITGQRMEMECRTDNESKVTAWYFAPSASKPNTPPVVLVANIGTKNQFSKNVSSEFGVDFDANGSGIIYLNVTRMNDSGLYTCEVESNSNAMKFSAQLIVFEPPLCGTNNLAGNVSETFWMQCRIRFRGNCTPVVEWTKYITSNGTEIPVADGSETVIGNGSVISTLTVMNGRSISLGVSFYSFKIFFFQMNSSGKGNASNNPEFRYKFPVDSVVFLSTVSPVSPIRPTIDASISKETTTGLVVETVYLMIIIVVVGVLFFVLSLVIVLVCWIFVRRRTAAWMANIVSSYENADRRSRVNRRSTTDCQRRETDVTSSADATIEQRCRPTSDGYTDADDIQEADNMTLEVKLRPASDGYTDADDIQEETLIASRSDHTLDENSELYATLRKNVEPPRCLSIYTS